MKDKLKYKILIIYLSTKWIFTICIGDKVIYQGKEYVVANGVRSMCWRLAGLDNGDGGWVRRVECKKVRTIRNFLGSFNSGYRFYMVNWYGIWVNSGIEPWMRGCNIWVRCYNKGDQPMKSMDREKNVELDVLQKSVLIQAKLQEQVLSLTRAVESLHRRVIQLEAWKRNLEEK